MNEQMNDNQIKRMVDRFLGWKLPENFSPDGGISFKGIRNENTSWPAKNEPTGTNLFDATQAEEMVRYMLAEPSPEPEAAPELAKVRANVAAHYGISESDLAHLQGRKPEAAPEEQAVCKCPIGCGCEHHRNQPQPPASDSFLPPLGDCSHHFTIEQVMGAVGSTHTKYHRNEIERRLHLMTSGQRYTLFGAVKQLVLASQVLHASEAQVLAVPRYQINCEGELEESRFGIVVTVSDHLAEIASLREQLKQEKSADIQIQAQIEAMEKDTDALREKLALAERKGWNEAIEACERIVDESDGYSERISALRKGEK